MSASAATGAGGDRHQTLVIMGAQGDLTSRMLLPGLGGLIAAVLATLTNGGAVYQIDDPSPLDGGLMDATFRY